MMDFPSASTMKMRFRQFVAFPDADIDFALEEATIACGTAAATSNSDWIDDLNLRMAIQYYAAHILQLTVQRGGAGSGGLVKTSQRTPELGISYQAPPWPTADQANDFNLTIYGTRFKDLISKNFPAVVVVNSAVRF